MSLLVALDLETTGLDPVNDHILEVGAVVFDKKFSELARFSVVVKPLWPWKLEELDPVVLKMHTDNKLLEHVKLFGRRRYQAEEGLHDFLSAYPETRGTPLVGNRIDFDKEFLRYHMPSIYSWFSHRNIDVSSLNEFARIWDKDFYKDRPRGDKNHRAMADALNSLAQLSRFGTGEVVKNSL